MSIVYQVIELSRWGWSSQKRLQLKSKKIELWKKRVQVLWIITKVDFFSGCFKYRVMRCPFFNLNFNGRWFSGKDFFAVFVVILICSFRSSFWRRFLPRALFLTFRGGLSGGWFFLGPLAQVHPGDADFVRFGLFGVGPFAFGRWLGAAGRLDGLVRPIRRTVGGSATGRWQTPLQLLLQLL